MKRNIERVILVAFVCLVMLGGYWLAGYEFKRCSSFGILYFFAVIASILSLILQEIIKTEKDDCAYMESDSLLPKEMED